MYRMTLEKNTPAGCQAMFWARKQFPFQDVKKILLKTAAIKSYNCRLICKYVLLIFKQAFMCVLMYHKMEVMLMANHLPLIFILL